MGINQTGHQEATVYIENRALGKFLFKGLKRVDPPDLLDSSAIDQNRSSLKDVLINDIENVTVLQYEFRHIHASKNRFRSPSYSTDCFPLSL